MVRPALMDSIIITAPQKYRESAISELYALNAVHVIDHTDTTLADIGKPLQQAAALSEELIKVRATIAELSIKKTKARLSKDFSPRKIVSLVKEFSERKKDIDAVFAKNSAIVNELSLVEWCHVPVQDIFKVASISVLFAIPKESDSNFHMDR